VGRIGPDDQAEAQKGDDGGGGAAPAQPVDAGQRAEQPGQQRIDEIGEDRDRHRNQLDRLEHAEQVDGEQHAEAERNPFQARRQLGTRGAQPQPDEDEAEADHAAEGEQRQHVAAGLEHVFAGHVRDTEHRRRGQHRTKLVNEAARAGRRIGHIASQGGRRAPVSGALPLARAGGAVRRRMVRAVWKAAGKMHGLPCGKAGGQAVGKTRTLFTIARAASRAAVRAAGQHG
jgi:hypothetical protein